MQDAKLVFSAAQAETTVAAHDSTNVVDLGIGIDEFGDAKDSNPGESGNIWLNVQVDTTFTSGGSATLAIKLQDSADNSSWVDTPIGTGAIVLATLAAGYTVLRIPLPTSDLDRYLKMVYTIGTAVMTAGAINAWLSHGPCNIEG